MPPAASGSQKIFKEDLYMNNLQLQPQQQERKVFHV